MKIATTVSVQILSRPANDPQTDWSVLDEGPGYIEIPSQHSIALFLPRAEDETAAQLAEDWLSCTQLVKVDVSEGRRMGDAGMRQLARLHQLTTLILNATGISNQGLEHLLEMPKLEWLDIGHCTSIGDLGLRRLEQLRCLRYINLRGCPRITQAGLKHLQTNHRQLQIHR